MRSKFRLMPLTLVCLGLVSAAGCALSMPQRALPPSQLQVWIENGNDKRPTLTFYNDDYDCFGVISVELDERSSKASAQIPHKAYTTFQSKWISHAPAEVGLDTVECEITATIDSRELSDITLRTEGNSTQCDVSVTGTTTSGETRSLPYQKRTRDILQFYTQGPFCQPDPRFQGSSTYAPPRG
ncbi:MAG: hypothetical protein V7756_03610 [Halopseudomonas sp.]|uniref:hypothetical protein n=1 Tax=Halopseudomonas sp. TaxID=2901191 RepID=UPI0030039EA8